MNTANGNPQTYTTAQALADCFELLEQAHREIAEYNKGYAAGYGAGLAAGRRELTCRDLVRQWLASWF